MKKEAEVRKEAGVGNVGRKNRVASTTVPLNLHCEIHEICLLHRSTNNLTLKKESEFIIA